MYQTVIALFAVGLTICLYELAVLRRTLADERRRNDDTHHHFKRLHGATKLWSGSRGDFDRVGPLSTGERLYVALASGRMRELVPGDSIAYAVDRVGTEWMAHMLAVWRSTTQPQN